MSRPRLYIPALTPGVATIALPVDEAHHVTRALRLRAGAEVRVFDGRGREWLATLAPSDRRAVAVRIEREITPVPEPSLRVTLAAGILKGDHMDAVVRDATMMGAAEIVPLVSAHLAVPRKAWKSGAALERWRRVAVASAKQCGRAVVPDITAPTTLDALLAAHAKRSILMFVEPSAGGEAIVVGKLPAPTTGAVLVLIGPEGGWAPGEIDRARAAGAVLVHLGPRTIRADAMATAALSAIQAVWGR